MLTQGAGSSHCISSTTSQQGHPEERHNLCSPHFIFCFEDLFTYFFGYAGSSLPYSVTVGWGYSVVVHGLFIGLASLVLEHRL